MGSDLHILRTSGHYIGQLRGNGYRLWRTVTGRCSQPENALAAAVLRMERTDKRARVLFVPTGETGAHYEPTLAMEARRR